MKPKLVEVEWDDARSVYSQLAMREVVEKCPLVRRYTAGYLVHRDRERLIVAGTYDPENEHEPEGGADFTTIPRGWIKAIVDLEPARKSDDKKETTDAE